jgi:predicted nucleotidyltransferase
MIRDGKRLLPDAAKRVPLIIKRVSEDRDVIALYVFGSLARNALKPLSDLDFAVYLSPTLDKHQRFDKHLNLIGLFNEVFTTDEIDLVIMNDASLRFAHHIIKTGKILFCRDQLALVAFCERIQKLYLDFRYFRDKFDECFLKGIGYHG